MVARTGSPIALSMLSALALSPLWTLPAGAAVLQVIYPRMEERPPADYGYQVLELALEKSGVPYRLTLSQLKMNHERARVDLEAGRVSVLDFGTSADFESRFRAVYFPVDRGLSGYRLLIINKSLAPAFASIRTLEDLRRMVAGQGPGWSDTEVLRASGLKVETAGFELLFRMVNAKRFDYFPLGAEEAHGLLARAKLTAPDCVVEDTLAIHYPFGRLFFVAKGNVELHDALMLGLKRAHTDGSLQRLLERNPIFSEGLSRSRLEKRTIIEIGNPSLTARFRQIPQEYFYRP